MNLTFSQSHINTLKKLLGIAEIHNCKINFGTRNSDSPDFDSDILNMCGVNKRITDKLDNSFEHNISIVSPCTNISEIWFELYDKNKGKYNTMSYGEFGCSFYIEKDYDFDEEKEKSLTDFIEENQTDYGWEDGKSFFNFRIAPTTIYGFKYKAKHRDFRVYRPDMALKYFGDLVCEYLKEPYIKEVY